MPPVPPAPPPVILAPPAITTVSRESSAMSFVRDGRQRSRSLLFDVVVRRGATVLWQGQMQTTSAGMASFNQRLQQSSLCTAGDDRLSATQSTNAMQISLMPVYILGAENSVRVSAHFERPVEAASAGCDGIGMRVVEMQSVIRPELGRPINLAGDADYNLSLTLRKEG